MEYDMTNVTVRNASIAFNPVIKLTPRKGAELVIDIADVPESILGDLLLTGLRIKATNSYNSGGAETPEADRRSNVERLVAAWKRGELNVGSSGPRDSMVGDMREAFIAKQVSLGKTVKAAEESIRKTVTAAFGPDEKATFPRFLDAVATMKAKQEGAGEYADIRAELEKAATDAVEALRKERAEATEELDIEVGDLF
jgi:hypothetical protein